MALSVLFLDRIAGISHGADAALRTRATNPRQILRSPAAESCRPYCRIEVGRSSRMQRLALHSADVETNFKIRRRLILPRLEDSHESSRTEKETIFCWLGGYLTW
jgi:hypothetical protein